MKRLRLILCICLFILSCNSSLHATNNRSEGRNFKPAELELVRAAAPKYILAVILDGAADKGDIKTEVVNTLKKEDKKNNFRYAWQYLPSPQTPHEIKSSLDKLRKKYFNNMDRSAFGILLVGKSFGAARLYKTITYNSDYFDNYKLIGVVYVDTHEPGAPGNKGRCDYWYDWVIFRCDGLGSSPNDYYDLKAHLGRTDVPLHFREYNVYQRRKYPKGYAFTHLGSRNIKEDTPGTNHWNILKTSAARDRYRKALTFALGQHHNPY